MNLRLIIALAALVASCATSRFDDPLPADADDSFESDAGDTPADCIAPPCASDNSLCVDEDLDGFGEQCVLGTDCDDRDFQMAPDLDEVCDGKDNDCNGVIDDGLSSCVPELSNTTCVDGDLDGYGEGCAPGGDCDDADTERFEGAPEACDGKDNDCDGDVDENFVLGQPCSAGMGACEASGTTICDEDGTTTSCDAPVRQPATEVCDRVDNDCDGTVDDGLNCPACIEDPHEPNDSSGAGTPLTSGSKTGQLCGTNRDWFHLGVYSAGATVSVAVDFVHAQGDIQIEMFSAGTFVAASVGSGDGESITHTVQSSGRVDVYLYFKDTPPAAGNAYTIRRP